MASSMRERIAKIGRAEANIMMDRVLARSIQEQSWGTPPILDAALVLIEADPTQGNRLAGFLRERPPAQITPSLIPKIADQAWAKDLFTYWRGATVEPAVKRAMTTQEKRHGHV
jgi:predicted KAP-like P-loop ATPase